MGRPRIVGIADGVRMGIILTKEQRIMLEELAELDNSSMNRVIRVLIEKEFIKLMERKQNG